MKRLLLLAMALVGATMAYAQEDSASVNVTGYAEVELVPDLFTLRITIAERDSKGKIAVDEQQRSMIKALKGVGIDTEEALKLANSSIDYYRRGDSLNTICYELTLNSSEELGAAFRALQPLGLSSVDITQATCSTLDESVAELRRQAIINARTKANDLAEAIGQSIGSCTYINDYNTSTHFNATMLKSRNGVAEAAYYDSSSEPQLDFRSEKLTYSVQARFELLPRR